MAGDDVAVPREGWRGGEPPRCGVGATRVYKQIECYVLNGLFFSIDVRLLFMDEKKRKGIQHDNSFFYHYLLF